MKHSLTKFRPVLTLEQIQYITNLCNTDGDERKEIYDPQMSQSIRKTLVPMMAKVEVGAISPAYKLSETHILKQAEKAEREKYEAGLMSPEEEAEYESKILGV